MSSVDDIRNSIMLVEELLSFYAKQEVPSPVLADDFVKLDEDVDIEHPILEELREATFIMNSVMESSGGDYALGFEQGMRRAAELIETIIRRHAGDSE